MQTIKQGRKAPTELLRRKSENKPKMWMSRRKAKRDGRKDDALEYLADGTKE